MQKITVFVFLKTFIIGLDNLIKQWYTYKITSVEVALLVFDKFVWV